MSLDRYLSRILAVTLVLLLAGAFSIFLAAPALTGYADNRAAVRNNALQAARFEQAANESDAIQQKLAVIDQAAGRNITLFTGDSAAIVAAALQDRVRRAVSEAGGAQRSAQVLSARNVADHVQAGVRIVATVKSSRLIDLLNDLETGQPTVLLGEFSVRANQRGARRGANTPSQDDPELTVNLVAYGFAAAAKSGNGNADNADNDAP